MQINKATFPITIGCKNDEEVLGLFDDEGQLRDHLAKDLTIIEPGLALMQTGFPVKNPLGADGSFDILAKDRFENFVIIEVKRSDQAARQALHELSKYIALFMEDQKVDRHRIRCFVVSTHWHELDVPVSFFKDFCPVEVTAFEIAAAGKTVTAKKRALPKVSLESRLSPDMRFSFFDSAEDQRDFCEELEKALRAVPHVRAALLVMDPIADRQRMCLLCAWRIPDIALNNVKQLVFDPDFQEEHYLFPGWEIETDLCDWLERQSDKAGWVMAEDSRATPEKIENYKSHYQYSRLVKLGDWPNSDLVTNLGEVMRCLVAKDVSAGASRANRHHFSATSSKSTGKSWEYASQAFKEFIRGNDLWLARYVQGEQQIPVDAIVQFAGYHMRHFYYAIHQAVEYSEAELSTFAISIKDDKSLDCTIFGGWLWDGRQRPTNARKNIERTYGSVAALTLLLYSAVDQDRYDHVYREHGFFPYVAVRSGKGNDIALYCEEDAPDDINLNRGLKEFVAANPEYCNDVSECLMQVPRNHAKSA